ncbi:MAG: tetratricopeptide repeat protein [Candidatus Brocadiae bacterium]|nr:tetratricopeptide repeat protein [Candidatus Brocadiia bacterium]
MTRPGGSVSTGAAPLPDRLAAERAYLFRHAVLRDAAYQLQIPGARAALHALAFTLIESLLGGRPPAETRGRRGAEPPWQPHPTDLFAEELAGHAALAGSGPDAAAAERLYLSRAARWEGLNFRFASSAGLWTRHAGRVSGIVRAESFRRAGTMAFLSDQDALAARLLGRSLRLSRIAGHLSGVAAALGSLASLHRRTDRLKRAEIEFKQALRIQRKIGDRHGEAALLSNLAVLYRSTQRPRLAERGYRQALTAFRKSGDIRNQGIVLGNLATLQTFTGRATEAGKGLKLALSLNIRAGDRWGEGVTRGNLGQHLQIAGRNREAEREYRRALAIHVEVGNRRDEGNVLGGLAILYRDTGRAAESEPAFLKAIALDREVRNRQREGSHLCDYALLLVALGRETEARRVWRSGLETLREVVELRSLGERVAFMRDTCRKAGVRALDSADL